MNKYIIRYMRNDGYCTTCSFNTGAKTSAGIGRAAAKAVSERCGGSIHDITMLDGHDFIRKGGMDFDEPMDRQTYEFYSAIHKSLRKLGVHMTPAMVEMSASIGKPGSDTYTIKYW